jgi:hypothetical protein
MQEILFSMKRTTQLKQKRLFSNPIRLYFLLVLVVFITVLLITSSSVLADDDDEDEEDDEDDDDEDLASGLGWASVGLFAASSVYIAFYQFYRVTRRLSKDGKQGETRKAITNVFLAVRKPLLYIHYFTGLAALVVLLIHGVLLTKDDTEAAIGWVTAGVYIFYIFTGILLWLKIINPKRRPNIRKTVLWVHRSLLIFAIIIAIHIVHLAIAD